MVIRTEVQYCKVNCVAQVLKDEIKERIFEAALNEFYQKDYKNATMRDMAEKAGILTGFVYSYYKNKQTLFDEIVQPVLLNLPETLKQLEKASGQPFDKFINIEKPFFPDLFDKRREFIRTFAKIKSILEPQAPCPKILQCNILPFCLLESGKFLCYTYLLRRLIKSRYELLHIG